MMLNEWLNRKRGLFLCTFNKSVTRGSFNIYMQKEVNGRVNLNNMCTHTHMYLTIVYNFLIISSTYCRPIKAMS